MCTTQQGILSHTLKNYNCLTSYFVIRLKDVCEHAIHANILKTNYLNQQLTVQSFNLDPVPQDGGSIKMLQRWNPDIIHMYTAL